MNTKERILSTSAQLFWQLGYEKVGVSDICKQSEVNKGTLYHFFPSKKDVALAVIQNRRESMQNWLTELRTLPAKKRIPTYFKDVQSVQEQELQNLGNFLGCPFGNMTVEMSFKEEDIRERVEESLNDVVDFFEETLQELLHTKKNVRHMGEHILIIAEGAQVLCKSKRSVEPLKNASKKVMEYIDTISS